MTFSGHSARQGFTTRKHPVARVLLISTALAVICLGFVTFVT